MRKIEAFYTKPWEALGDLLFRMHWKESQTIEAMGSILGVHETTLRQVWFKRMDLDVRSPNDITDPNAPINISRRRNLGWEDPGIVEERNSGLLKSWGDPATSEDRLSKSQSEKARSKRSESMKQWARSATEDQKRSRVRKKKDHDNKITP